MPGKLGLLPKSLQPKSSKLSGKAWRRIHSWKTGFDEFGQTISWGALMLTLAEVLSDFRAYSGYDRKLEVTVESRSARGETPLHWMCTLGDHVAIGLLVSAGADIDAQDEAGNAPIHEACAHGQWTALSALINAGADISLINRAGLAALGVAMQQGFRPCVELLSGRVGTLES